MDFTWEYNCPQFFDFKDPVLDENADTFFDHHQEHCIMTDNTSIENCSQNPGRVLKVHNCVVQQTCDSKGSQAKNKKTGIQEDKASSGKVGVSYTNVGKENYVLTEAVTHDSGNQTADKTKSDDGTEGCDDCVPGKEIQTECDQNEVNTEDKQLQEQADNDASLQLENNLATAVDNIHLADEIDKENSRPPPQRLHIQKQPAATSNNGKSSSSSKLKRSNSFSNTSRRMAASVKRFPSTEQLSHCSGRHRSNSQSNNSCSEPKTKGLLNLLDSSKNGNKSTEELEMERISRMRREMEAKRKATESFYKKSMFSSGIVPVCCGQKQTVPQDFIFQTDARVKNKVKDTYQELNVCDFANVLRKATITAQNQKLPRQMVKPFALSEMKKKTNEQQGSESYMPLAEKIHRYQVSTPLRFRPHKKEAGKQRSLKLKANRHVIPKTPNLETKNRTRPIHILSQREKEERELEEIAKHQFKANPLKTDIFTSTAMGVKEASRPTTVAVNYSLHTDKRVREREAKAVQSEEKYVFHARPLPKKIFQEIVGIAAVPKKEITMPQSPAFSLKQRVHMPVVSQEEEKNDTQIHRARPLRHIGLPFHPVLNHKHTMPEPFQFEERDKELRIKKEEKIKEILEEEKKARGFHANPLPEPTVNELPTKERRTFTIPKPYVLDADIRGQQKEMEWNKKMEEEENQRKALALFKARPCNVVHKAPFVPQKVQKSLTDITSFELNTEKRAQKREEFEQYKKSKELENESVRQLKKSREEEEEMARLAKLRSELVYKANPVRQFKMVEIVSSSKPLTKAVSPVFATDKRLKEK